MFVLTSKFPFVKFVKKVSGDYFTIEVTQKAYSSKEKEIIKLCKNRLLNNGVPINKIRFVLSDVFVYDIDKNLIDPPYKKLVPFNSSLPMIEVGKSPNVMTIVLGLNKTYNNYGLLKQAVKNTKRGIVVLATQTDYEVELLMANLDIAYQYYVTENCDND
jgi:hypothetical protein